MNRLYLERKLGFFQEFRHRIKTWTNQKLALEMALHIFAILGKGYLVVCYLQLHHYTMDL